MLALTEIYQKLQWKETSSYLVADAMYSVDTIVVCFK